jgi:hypothetical protein
MEYRVDFRERVIAKRRSTLCFPDALSFVQDHVCFKTNATVVSSISVPHQVALYRRLEVLTQSHAAIADARNMPSILRQPNETPP